MSDEYPKWLIQRVAAAFWNAQMDSSGDYDYDYLVERAKTGEGDYAEILAGIHAGSVGVLDALGFKRRFSSGQLVAGQYVSWNLIGPRTDYYCYRSQTEWMEVPK